MPRSFLVYTVKEVADFFQKKGVHVLSYTQPDHAQDQDGEVVLEKGNRVQVGHGYLSVNQSLESGILMGAALLTVEEAYEVYRKRIEGRN